MRDPESPPLEKVLESFSWEDGYLKRLRIADDEVYKPGECDNGGVGSEVVFENTMNVIALEV